LQPAWQAASPLSRLGRLILTHAESTPDTSPTSASIGTWQIMYQMNLFGTSLSTQQDFLVSHSALLARDAARLTTAISGLKLNGQLAFSGPLGCFVRMCLESLSTLKPSSALTLRPWAMPGSRLGFRLVPLAHRISESESGLLPTLRAQDSYERSNRKTVVAAHKGEAQMTLTRKLRLPTLTSRDWRSGKGSDRTDLLAEVIGGTMNPTWAEWFMGYPKGWTALDASATPSSRKSRRGSCGGS
jgi:hypothetical protein